MTGGLSMDMVAGSMLLVERDDQGDPSLLACGAQKEISILFYTFILFSILDAFL